MSDENHTGHEKSHAASNLVYLGYGSLTAITVLQSFLGNLDADLKILWASSTASLVTWLVAKSNSQH